MPCGNTQTLRVSVRWFVGVAAPHVGIRKCFALAFASSDRPSRQARPPDTGFLGRFLTKGESPRLKRFMPERVWGERVPCGNTQTLRVSVCCREPTESADETTLPEFPQGDGVAVTTKSPSRRAAKRSPKNQKGTAQTLPMAASARQRASRPAPAVLPFGKDAWPRRGHGFPSESAGAGRQQAWAYRCQL